MFRDYFDVQWAVQVMVAVLVLVVGLCFPSSPAAGDVTELICVLFVGKIDKNRWGNPHGM